MTEREASINDGAIDAEDRFFFWRRRSRSRKLGDPVSDGVALCRVKAPRGAGPNRRRVPAMKIASLALKSAAALAVSAAVCAAPSAAAAQNFLNMDLNAMNQQFNARMNQQMATQQEQVIQQVLRSPQAMAMYPTCGRGLTPRQFAYKYAATGGCTAAGAQAYMRQSQDIARRDQQAFQGYQGAVQTYRNAYNGWTAGQSANLQEAGRGLMGRQTYYDPQSGRNLDMSYLPQGNGYYDPRSGRSYVQDGRGGYVSAGADGVWRPVGPAARAPR